jgi:hypothetical protein
LRAKDKKRKAASAIATAALSLNWKPAIFPKKAMLSKKGGFCLKRFRFYVFDAFAAFNAVLESF